METGTSVLQPQEVRLSWEDIPKLQGSTKQTDVFISVMWDSAEHPAELCWAQTSDLQRAWENNWMLFEVTEFVVICYGQDRKLMRLVIFGWMPDIMNWTLLGAGYLCIPINIPKLFYWTQVSYLKIVWILSRVILSLLGWFQGTLHPRANLALQLRWYLSGDSSWYHLYYKVFPLWLGWRTILSSVSALEIVWSIAF